MEIKDLLGKISARAPLPAVFPCQRTLWMNFHRVYPDGEAHC
ncbi:MAG TPA: hypothetical protein VGD76_20140 [Ramlibacter sp.]